ncbi:MAG TPA: hypothetical protein VMT85_12980 [Thermoanaerobaculia bacterium]|nr:hypothetical protein [Thermoanaerobaculia bacterium]
MIAVGDDSAGVEAVPALSVRLPGAARGWTPSSGECLDSGDYGWAVRAVRADTDERVDTVGDTMTGDLVMSGADLDLGVGDGAIVRAGTLFLHSRGNTNTALGLQALSSVTLGTGNTAVGFAATVGRGRGAASGAPRASSGWRTLIPAARATAAPKRIRFPAGASGRSPVGTCR